MRLRTVVLVLAGLGIPLSLLVLFLPITWGYGGYNWNPDGSTAVVVFLDPAGPAARAGLRIGDRIEYPRGYDSIVEQAGPAGSVVHERVIRNGRSTVLTIPFVRFFGALSAQELFTKLLLALTAMAAFIIAILVVLRARDAAVGARAACVLLLAGAGAFSQSTALVCGSAWLAFVLSQCMPPLLGGAGILAALSLLAVYPPNRPALRRSLLFAGYAALGWGVLSAWAEFNAAWSGTWTFATLPSVTAAANFAFDAVMCVAIVDAITKAKDTYAVPMRWLGGMWLLGIALGASTDIALIARMPALGHYGDMLRAANVFCLAFGIAYPVMRHRLVDLNLLVSRATVFAIVSAIVVGIFIAAEWGIGKIFEQSVGLSGDRRGLAAQIATLGVALLLGLSARPIHRFVDERLTQTFFRTRFKALAEIERVAREADAATDANAIMDIGVQTVQRCLQPLGTAFYLRVADRYERTTTSGSLAFPAAYGFNDAAPLRLRRWQEAFEIDDESDDRHHMLFIPMTLRGELLGFLCCGPKPDRTAYLSDEISALSLLAHHTGIAAAWLARTPLSPHLSELVSPQVITAR